MTEAIENRLADLRRKLAARKGQKPYKKNCEAIQAEISRLENILLNATENPDGHNADAPETSSPGDPKCPKK